VLTVRVDQGNKVQAGQILGEIDPVDIDHRLQSASSAISKAQSAMAVTEAQVRDVYSRNTLAQTNAKRYSDLLASQAALDVARASLAAAQEEVSGAASDRNAITRQQANLQLISPINGIIVSRDAELGTTVVAGQSVFHLIDPQTLWVQTRIDQTCFYGIAVGQLMLYVIAVSILTRNLSIIIIPPPQAQVSLRHRQFPILLPCQVFY